MGMHKLKKRGQIGLQRRKTPLQEKSFLVHHHKSGSTLIECQAVSINIKLKMPESKMNQKP